jgi:hypothetical protein
MKEEIHAYGVFAWALLCACLGLACEWAGQMMLFGGHWFQEQAQKWNEYAEILVGID